MTSYAGISFHRDGFGPFRPAVDVKVHGRVFGAPDLAAQLVETYGCDQADAERVAEIAWESAVDTFWTFLAPHHAKQILSGPFGVDGVVYAEGRSGGWLIVDGIESADVDEWTQAQADAWIDFANVLQDEIDYLCRFETIREDIDANGWLEREFERNGMVETQ